MPILIAASGAITMAAARAESPAAKPEAIHHGGAPRRVGRQTLGARCQVEVKGGASMVALESALDRQNSAVSLRAIRPEADVCGVWLQKKRRKGLERHVLYLARVAKRALTNTPGTPA